jgi:hypothetical protein
VAATPRSADIRDGYEQFARLAGIDDDSAIHYLGHLRRHPLHPVERICRKLLQLGRVTQDVVEDRSLAADRRCRSRRAV